MTKRTLYLVLSKRGDDEFVETIRTSKRAAQEDVAIFKDIIRRATWIREVEK